VPRRLARLPCLAIAGLRVVVAAGPLARLAGLAGLRAPPPPGVALLLAPCRSVHTVGMRWALDLVWLGPGGEVVRVDRAVAPGRLRTCRGARAVLEAPAGAADIVLAAQQQRH
jgi:uncharacterized protein